MRTGLLMPTSRGKRRPIAYAVLVFLISRQLVWRSVLLGLNTPPSQLPKDSAMIVIQADKQAQFEVSIGQIPVKVWNASNLGASPMVSSYNDSHFASETRLSRNWILYKALDRNVSLEQVDSNSCFEARSNLPTFLGFSEERVTCLPALYVIGFEKCGTTVLNIWLSYHPNLRTSWREGRFFDTEPEVALKVLETQWHDYLSTLPTISKAQVGQVWTLEKSPAYAQNPFAARILSTLVPSAKLLLVVRNPTQRAYSMFLMYTHHYPDVTSAVYQRPVSYFVKNRHTGDVRYIRDGFREFHPQRHKTPGLPPGVGGTQVSPLLSPNGTMDWEYLAYPPHPHDFDAFIRHIRSKHNPQTFSKKIQGRAQRILTGGLYGTYLQKQWLQYTAPENLLVIPSETFFAPQQAVESMDQLQRQLGLPRFDYDTILTEQEATGRYEIVGSLATVLNNRLNNYGGKASPMLPQTKHILDDFYCESNRQLAALLSRGNYTYKQHPMLSGYSCL